jgi:hypothetical protein
MLAFNLDSSLFSGAKMALDTKDISFVPHLALDGIWEEPVTRAWLKVIKPNYTTLDIGANFGYFGLLAKRQTHAKGSSTIFFEANSALIPFIKKTLSINNYMEFSEIENVAISDKKGSLKLYYGVAKYVQDHLELATAGMTNGNSEMVIILIGNKCDLEK